MPLDENGQTVIRDFQMRPHALVVRAWHNFNNCRSYKISFYVVQYEVSGGNGSVSVGGDDEIEKEMIADIYNPIDEDVITAPTDIFGRADLNISRQPAEITFLSQREQRKRIISHWANLILQCSATGFIISNLPCGEKAV